MSCRSNNLCLLQQLYSVHVYEFVRRRIARADCPNDAFDRSAYYRISLLWSLQSPLNFGGPHAKIGGQNGPGTVVSWFFVEKRLEDSNQPGVGARGMASFAGTYRTPQAQRLKGKDSKTPNGQILAVRMVVGRSLYTF